MKKQNKKLSFKLVLCNGCKLCCLGDAGRLMEKDNPVIFITKLHPYIPGALMLAHKSNGDYVYLIDSGCSIHDRAPSICRSADCRILSLKYDFGTAMKLHQLNKIDIRV